MIRFYCRCGKRLKVDAAYAGRHVKCGACGAKAVVPSTSEAEAVPAAAPADGLDALAQALRAPVPPVAAATPRAGGKPVRGMPARPALSPGGGPAPRGPAPSARSLTDKVRHKEAGGNKTLFIGFGAALALIIALVILMWVTGSSSNATTQADNAATPSSPAPAKKESAANKDNSEPRTAVELPPMKESAAEAAAKKDAGPGTAVGPAAKKDATSVLPTDPAATKDAAP